MPHYLVVTFSDQNQATTAYQRLQETQLPLAQIDLVGAGHKTLQEVNVCDPNQIAWQQATRMMFLLIPFGFIAGFSFNDITKLTIIEQGSPLLNHILGGLLGAGSGAMGGFTFGGRAQFLIDPEKTPFAQRVKSGKLLLIAQGTELLVRQARKALQDIPSESLQFYEEQF